jgi:uncharacterized damage-inducible protein DinB
MAETPQRLVERLSDEGRKSVDFFKDLSPDQWEHPVYSEGSCWSVRQVLAHFVSAERAFGRLIQDVLDGGEGAPEGFDIDRFNEGQVSKMGGLSPRDLLTKFEESRQASVELVERMQTADLSRVGRHPFLGQAALGDIIKLLYRHNQIHQRDIRKSLAAAVSDIQA